MIIRTVTRALFAGYPGISVALVFLFCSPASSLLAQTTNWTNAGTGDWLNATNWDNGIPGNNTEAIVDNGGTAQLLSATGFAETLVVGENATGSFLLGGTGRLTTTETLIGAMAGSTGTVTVQDNAIWTNVDIISIGTEGTGTLTIQGNGQVFTNSVLMGEAATAMGTLNLLGGSLSTGQIAEVNTGGRVVLDGGILMLTTNQSALFSGFEAGDVVLGSQGAIIDTAREVTSSVGLVGTGGLIKTGVGKLTLTGTSTYTGPTVVSGGTLAQDGYSATSSLSVGVVNSANYELAGGSLQTSGVDIGSSNDGDLSSLTVSRGGTLNNSGTTRVGVSSAGSLVVNGGSVTTPSVQLGVGNDELGILQLNGGTLRTGQISKGAGSAIAQLNGTIVLTGDQTDFFANFSSLPGEITLNAGTNGQGGLTFNTNGFNANINAPLTGSGGLEKQGGGTLTLSGASSYEGLTVVEEGTLAFSNRLTQTSQNSALFVQEQGQAQILENAVVTIGGDLEVSGEVVIEDGGRLNVLDIAIIRGIEGVVKLGDNALFSAASIILESSSLQSTGGTPTVRTTGFSAMAGGSDLVLPSLVLEAASDQTEYFDGFERVLANVLANGELTFDTRGFEVSTNAAIQADRFTKTGEGILSLNGDTQATSGFTVLEGQLTIGGTATDGFGAYVGNDGTLIVNGTLNGGVLVDGILGGTGVVTDFVNVFNGTVSPGLSPGTLIIGGNLVLGPDATLLIEVEGLNPGEFDRVLVGGTASLGGTLALDVAPGVTLQAGEEFSFLIADGGITGTFDDVVSNFPGALDFEISGNSILLVPTPYTEFARTPNQFSIATALDAERFFNPNSPFTPFFSVWDNLPTEELSVVLQQLDPAQTSATLTTTLSLGQSNAVRFANRMQVLRNTGITPVAQEPAVFDPKSGPKDAPMLVELDPYRYGLWFEGGGSFAEVTGQGFNRGFGIDSGIANAGFDYSIGNGLTLGLFAGYQGAETDIDGNGGKIDLNGGGGNLYLLYQMPETGFYLQTMAGANANHYETTRNFLLPGFGPVSARGDTDGIEVNSNSAAGWQGEAWGLQFNAEAGLRYAYAQLDGYTESGAFPFNVAYQSQEAESLQSSLTARISRPMELADRIWIPELRAGWRHEFLDQDYTTNGRFAAGLATPFAVTSEGPGRDTAELGAGLTVLLSDALNLTVNYDAQLGGDYLSHNLTALVNFRW